eukprot:s493_g6.t1
MGAMLAALGKTRWLAADLRLSSQGRWQAKQGMETLFPHLLQGLLQDYGVRLWSRLLLVLQRHLTRGRRLEQLSGHLSPRVCSPLAGKVFLLGGLLDYRDMLLKPLGGLTFLKDPLSFMVLRAFSAGGLQDRRYHLSSIKGGLLQYLEVRLYTKAIPQHLKEYRHLGVEGGNLLRGLGLVLHLCQDLRL